MGILYGYDDIMHTMNESIPKNLLLLTYASETLVLLPGQSFCLSQGTVGSIFGIGSLD